MSRAIFLDRDGTIIEDAGYLGDPDGVVLLPGAAESLARLQAAGYLLVVVSNQSGVARGYFSREAMHAVNARMRRKLAENGVTIAAVHCCPHGPESDCNCRKPLPGMLHEAARALGIDLAQSVMIGDKPRDVEAGMAAGCARNILIDPTDCGRNIVPDLVAAAALILGD